MYAKPTYPGAPIYRAQEKQARRSRIVKVAVENHVTPLTIARLVGLTLADLIVNDRDWEVIVG